MICEENISKAKVLQDLLNVYNFKLITLTRGKDFLRQVQSHKPSVIIINENFTRQSGNEVIDRLRSNPVTCRIPIICISENDSEISLDEYSDDSFVEFMKEPYKIKQLRHYIDRWTTFRSLYVKQ